MLDLYKLSIFVQVADQGSFSRAAEHLYMSQSGVSQHMQELENALGVRLFNRERRGVSPTSAGQLLLDYARTILSTAAEAEAVLADLASAEQGLGPVSIGATPGVSAYLLPEWLYQFQMMYPDLSVAVQTATTEQVAASIHAGQLDLGFVEGELPSETMAGLEYTGLQEIEQMIVVGNNHRWWQQPAVNLHDLHDQPLVVRQVSSQTRVWIDQLFEEHHIRPRIVAELDNLESIKRMVIGGKCFAIMPEYAVRHERELGLMRLLPVRDYSLRRTLKLVWQQGSLRSPVARAFLRVIQKQFPGMSLPSY